jgi:hypothetical protein
MGLAAIVLYLSSMRNSEHVTQKDIAAAAGVTELTLRNRLKNLKIRLGLIRSNDALAYDMQEEKDFRISCAGELRRKKINCSLNPHSGLTG